LQGRISHTIPDRIEILVIAPSAPMLATTPAPNPRASSLPVFAENSCQVKNEISANFLRGQLDSNPVGRNEMGVCNRELPDRSRAPKEIAHPVL
jgi:hypothetical protein